MHVRGPYVFKSGKVAGRKYVQIIHDDGHRETTLYSRHLMEQHLGRELESWEHVDHIDEDKTNDDISNLQILTNSANARKSALGKPSPLRGVEKGFTHGTSYGWMKKKCSCEICQAAKRVWNEQRNVRRKKRGVVVELADTSVLGTDAERREGSSPSGPTKE